MRIAICTIILCMFASQANAQFRSYVFVPTWEAQPAVQPAQAVSDPGYIGPLPGLRYDQQRKVYVPNAVNLLSRNVIPVTAKMRRPGDWTWPGELRSHLMGSPHNLPASQINALSVNEVLNLHNSLHDTEKAVPARRSAPKQVFRQLCPT